MHRELRTGAGDKRSGEGGEQGRLGLGVWSDAVEHGQCETQSSRRDSHGSGEGGCSSPGGRLIGLGVSGQEPDPGDVFEFELT